MTAPAAARFLLAGALVVSACTSSSHPAAARRTDRDGVVRVAVSLGDGRSEASTAFEQPFDPQSHTADIRLEMPSTVRAPSVWVVTADKGKLILLDPGRAKDFCSVEGQTKRCWTLIERLEGVLPGRWELWAAKDSGPPATIKVTFSYTFEPKVP